MSSSRPNRGHTTYGVMYWSCVRSWMKGARLFRHNQVRMSAQVRAARDCCSAARMADRGHHS